MNELSQVRYQNKALLLLRSTVLFLAPWRVPRNRSEALNILVSRLQFRSLRGQYGGRKICGQKCGQNHAKKSPACWCSEVNYKVDSTFTRSELLHNFITITYNTWIINHYLFYENTYRVTYRVTPLLPPSLAKRMILLLFGTCAPRTRFLLVPSQPFSRQGRKIEHIYILCFEVVSSALICKTNS